jgi:hypothetical protein
MTRPRSHLPIIRRAGQSLHPLLLSANHYNTDPDRKTVVTAHVVTNRDPGELLAVRLEPIGWATLTVLETTPKRNLGERVAAITTDEMTNVDAALAALLDLG